MQQIERTLGAITALAAGFEHKPNTVICLNYRSSAALPARFRSTFPGSSQLRTNLAIWGTLLRPFNPHIFVQRMVSDTRIEEKAVLRGAHNKEYFLIGIDL